MARIRDTDAFIIKCEPTCGRPKIMVSHKLSPIIAVATPHTHPHTHTHAGASQDCACPPGAKCLHARAYISIPFYLLPARAVCGCHPSVTKLLDVHTHTRTHASANAACGLRDTTIVPCALSTRVTHTWQRSNPMRGGGLGGRGIFEGD